MQKPTTSDPSFKNFIEGLKNTNVSAVEPRPVQVGQLQPESDVVGSQTEGLNTLYREEKDANKEQKEFYKLQKQHNLIQENQFKQIVKSLENLNKLFSAKAEVQNKANKLDYKGLPDQAKDLTYSEVLKQGVAKVKGVGSSVKSMGKSIVSAFKDPTSAVKSLYSNVKGSTKSMVENVKDIASTKENYTPGQERFAKAYAASEEGLSEKGSETDKLNAGSDKYDALKAKQEEINVVKEKMNVPASQGFDPLKKDVKELANLENQFASIDPRVKKERESEVTGGVGADKPVTVNQDKLENQFASIDPRVKKEEVLNNKVNTEVVKKERESEVTGGVGADKPVTVNQESDNVVSAPEAVAEGTKADLEVSKQLLETTREQLTVLKEIKEALSPETPKELTEQKSAPSATEKEKEPGILDSLPNIDVDLPDGRRGPKGVPKGAGKPSLGSRIKGLGSSIKGAGSNIFKGAGGLLSAGGAVAAATTIGGGLALNYGLTKGADAITEAAGADTNVTPEMEAQDQANWDKASFFEKAQSGVARGIEGVGGFLGADKTVAAAKAARIKSETEYLKSNEAEAKPAETVAGKKGSSGAEGQAADQKLIDEFVKAYPPSKGFTYEAMGQGLTISKDGKKVRTLGSAFSKELKTMDAATFAGLAMKSEGQTAKTEAEAKPAETAAVVPIETVNGKKAEYAGDIKVASATSAGALSSDPQFDKDIREHRKQARDVKLKKPDPNYLDATPDTKPGTGNYLDVTPDTEPSIKPDNYLAPAKATPVGASVAKTSTENADMGREAGKGGGNNTVVSNNVSTNNTTTYVPIKATPRAESQGSALDRYQNRVSSFG